MNLGLGNKNGLRVVSGDIDVVGITATRIRGAVSVRLGEQRREVNCGAGRRFDKLDVFAMAATDELVNGVVDFGDV